ncbi:MAG: hypothetical protein AAF224_07170 [Pseudomonadota bacterium]
MLAFAYGASYAFFSVAANLSSNAPFNIGVTYRVGHLVGFAIALIICMPPIIFFLKARADKLSVGAVAPPRSAIAASGCATALIALTTATAFSFSGVSIIFALLLMRGGVLILAPAIDVFSQRRIRAVSIFALVISLIIVSVSLLSFDAAVDGRGLLITLAIYLGAYSVRLNIMSRVAKNASPGERAAYARSEFFWAGVFLVLLVGIALSTRVMFLPTAPFSGVAGYSILSGFCYSAVLLFGTLIYLHPKENTFTIPINRGASLVGGMIGAFAGAGFGLTTAPSVREAVGALVILLVLGVLAAAEKRVDQYTVSKDHQ